MSDVTKSGILSALKRVDDPNFNKDLLILNSVRSFDIEKDKLFIELSLPVPESGINQNLIEKLETSVKNEFAEISSVEIKLQAKSAASKGSKTDSLLPGVKNTVAVASGKGGVGKSTVAVNLAVALAKEGAKVGLIDADIYGPSIPLMLGLKEKPKLYQNQQTKKIIPLENYGLKLISIGVFLDDNAPVIWRGPMASGALKQFMTDVDWGELDYLFFDMPPGTGDIQLTLVQTVPLTGGIIVTTPQEVSLIDARKALKMFTRVNVPVLGIVENMSYFIAPDTGKKYNIFGLGGGSKLADELSIPFLGGIPIDPRIREGGDNGIPIVHDMPDSENAKIISQINKNLAQQIHVRSLNPAAKVEISLDDDE
jgi:ATP-binding protein involved in chromosome partitioning